jgi:hypothetical protein
MRSHLPNNNTTDTHFYTHTSFPQSRIATSSSDAIVEAQQEDKQPGIMAASFLQFCATCEKQIFTPCNTILYCSEA